MSHFKIVSACLSIFLFSSPAFSQVSIVFDETFTLSGSSNGKKIKQIFDRSLTNSSFEGEFFLQFSEDGSKNIDADLRINGRKVDIEGCGGKKQDELNPIYLDSQNSMTLKLEGRAGETVRIRIFNLKSSIPVLLPVLMNPTKDVPASVQFLSPEAGREFLLVVRDKDWSADKISLNLNGESIFRGKRNLGKSSFVKLVTLSSSNEIVTYSKNNRGGSIEVAVFGHALSGQEDNRSTAVVEFSNLDPALSYSVLQPVGIRITGSSFKEVPEVFGFFRNGRPVSAEIFFSGPHDAVVGGLFEDGLNEIEIFGQDVEGKPFRLRGEFWAGSVHVQLSLVNGDGTPFEPASLMNLTMTAEHESRRMSYVIPVIGSVASFSNVPKGTVVVTSSDPLKTVSEVFNLEGDVATSIPVFDSPPVTEPTNLDFLNGLDGWTILSGDVRVVPNVQEQSNGRASLLSTPGQQTGLSLYLSSSQPYFRDCPQGSCLYGYAASVTRSVRVPVGTRAVTIEYDQIDHSTVFYRGAVVGVGQEDPRLSTFGMWTAGEMLNENTWRGSKTFYLNGSEQTIQIGFAVYAQEPFANTVSMSVRRVVLSGFAIEAVQLWDVGPHALLEPISALSAGATNPEICGGTIPLNLSFVAQGLATDSIDEISVEFQENRKTVAIAHLAKEFAAFDDQIRAPFGSDGRHAYNFKAGAPFCSGVLRLASTEAAKITGDELVTPIITFKTKLGEVQKVSHSRLPVMIRFTAGNRFPPNNPNDAFDERDVRWGGDEWGRPYTVGEINRFNAVLNALPDAERLAFGFRVNDFSNMHGGYFPPHEAHRRGYNVDARLLNFPVRPVVGPVMMPGAQAAEQLVNFLQLVGTENVQSIIVSFSPVVGDPFFDAIRGRTLGGRPLFRNRQNNGIIASDHASGFNHLTHFHIQFYTDER